MTRSSACSSQSPGGVARHGRSTPSLALLVRVLIAIGLVLPTASVLAQGEPPVGVRAAGMAGAFTAVADDATAAVWNPAGLASGSYFSVALDGSHFDRQSALFAGFGSPPLALTYLRSATAGVSRGRNMLVAHNFGVSLVQSVGDTGLAVGTTLKLVHGVTSGGGVPSASANAFDADAGVMLSGGLGQIGLAVRNLSRPSFGEIRMDRKVRGGAAVHVNDRTTLAADVEFTKDSAAGGWRDAAVGIETHPLSSTWIRGGIHWNTAGAQAGEPSGARPIVALGMSYALRGALMADAQASVGSAAGNRGWGIGLRFAF